MTIVGCDFHPSWQQIAILDMETGEVRECKLVNGNGEAERFYRQLPTLIGVEACGNSQWFVDLLQQLGHKERREDRNRIEAAQLGEDVVRDLLGQKPFFKPQMDR